MKLISYLGLIATVSLTPLANANASSIALQTGPNGSVGGDIVSETYTGNAPLEGYQGGPGPQATTFTGYTAVGNLSGQYSSPYTNNKNSLATTAYYNVLAVGETATYTVDSDYYSILWGSPSIQNTLTFNLANGYSYYITGDQLICSHDTQGSGCYSTGFDLVTFNLGSEITSVTLADSGQNAFEFGVVTPIPGSVYLFGSAFAGLGLFGLRRRRVISGSAYNAA